MRLNGVALAAGGTFTQADLAAGRVSFLHDGGEAGGSFGVSLTDGIAPAQTATVTAAVNSHVDDAPVITSDGGHDVAAISIAENAKAVTHVTASDVDGGALAYSLAGGADAALFVIDPTSGVLAFKNAPDFEAPADAGHDNVYDVVIKVADGIGGSDTQSLSVSVTDVAGVTITGTTAQGPYRSRPHRRRPAAAHRRGRRYQRQRRQRPHRRRWRR